VAFAEAIAARDASLPPPVLLPTAVGIVLLQAAGPQAPVAGTLQTLLTEAGYPGDIIAQVLARLEQWAAGKGGEPVLEAAGDAVALATQPRRRPTSLPLKTAAAQWVAKGLF
jgi:hypothetical protein